MILIDTQILIWWTTSEQPPDGPPRAAMRAFDSLRAGGVAASAVSVWEIALKVERGRLDFGGTAEQWYALAKGIPYLTFLPLTAEIALCSQTHLRDFAHRDPADGFILATAMAEGLRLLTTDAAIRVYAGDRAIPLQ